MTNNNFKVFPQHLLFRGFENLENGKKPLFKKVSLSVKKQTYLADDDYLVWLKASEQPINGPWGDFLFYKD